MVKLQLHNTLDKTDREQQLLHLLSRAESHSFSLLFVTSLHFSQTGKDDKLILAQPSTFSQRFVHQRFHYLSV